MKQQQRDRLNRLFEVSHRASEAAFSNTAVAEAITRRRGAVIDAEEIRQLRAGTKRDATVQQWSALAEFFGVASRYLTNPEPDPVIDAQLDLLEALRDRGVRGVHGYGNRPLSVEETAGLADTIRRLPPE